MNRSKTLIAALSLLVGAAATSACKDEAQDTETSDEGAAPAADEPAQPSAADEPAPSPAEPEAKAETYEITATQLGPLTADTEATAEGIAQAFPEATVTASKQMAEGTEHEIFVVEIDGQAALVVTPGADGSIDRARTSSDHFRTASGLGVGSSFEELQAAGELACIGGADDQGGTVLCRPKDIPTLAFVFTAPEARDYYAKPVPAEAQGKLLAGKKAVELLWQPGLGD